MSLTITTQQLLDAAPGLRALGAYDIPDVKGSYALTKVKRAANPALEDVEVSRVGLCEKHARKDDLGKALRKEDGNYDIADQAAFAADWKTLMAQPVELVGCRALTVDEFSGAAQVIRHPDGKTVEIVRGINPDLFFALGPIVTDPSPPDAAK